MEALTDFSEVTTAELETSITSLCADMNAATYRQLSMIAEFDLRCGWGDDGTRSCAHWLNWHCGISTGTAREKVRVAHALKKLPKTSLAFASGELSYSKARAITRVGTVNNEDYLLSYARYGSASHLDNVVKLYRTQYDSAGQLMCDYHAPMCAPDSELDPALLSDEERFAIENEGAMHNHDYRQVTSYWDEHGCLIIKARLTAEQGAVVMKAMDVAMEELKAREPSVESTIMSENGETDAEAAPHSLHSHDHQSQKENYQDENYQDRKLQEEIDEKKEMDKCRLENRRATRRRADSLVLMAEALLRDTKVASTTDDRYQVVVNVDSQVLAKEVFEKPDGRPDCYIDGQVALPVETARRLSCSCKIVTALTCGGEPLSVGRSSRAISLPIQRALNLRDGGCTFPGCDCRKHLEAHHIVHWANGGETSLENLTQVCHYHHQLLHEGQYSVERLPNGQLLFRHPDGRELRQQPMSSDAAIDASDLASSNAEPWSWCGDSMDYSVALSGLARVARDELQAGELSHDESQHDELQRGELPHDELPYDALNKSDKSHQDVPGKNDE